AVVDTGPQRPVILDCTVVRPRKSDTREQHIRRIWDAGAALMRSYHPELLAFEAQHQAGLVGGKGKTNEAAFYVRDIAGMARGLGFAHGAHTVKIAPATLDSRFLHAASWPGRDYKERRAARKAAIK